MHFLFLKVNIMNTAPPSIIIILLIACVLHTLITSYCSFWIFELEYYDSKMYYSNLLQQRNFFLFKSTNLYVISCHDLRSLMHFILIFSLYPSKLLFSNLHTLHTIPHSINVASLTSGDFLSLVYLGIVCQHRLWNYNL